MKTAYRHFIVLIISLVLSSKSYSGIHIDSIYVYKLLVNDTFNVYVGIENLVLPYTCGLASSNVTNSNDTVIVSLCYNYPGSSAVLCHIYDSIFIGSFSQGNYHVSVYIDAVDSLDASCYAPAKRDSFFLTFSVISGISKIQPEATLWNISPNPTTSWLNIQSPSATTLQLTTTDGRVVLEQSAAMQNKWEVDVSSLPKGLYFAVLQTEQGRAVRRWVKE